MDKIKIAETIKAEVERIFTRDTYPYEPDNISVEIINWKGETAVQINISSMYNSPGLKFSDLLALSKYFGGTTRIDTVNDWAEGGCETCDYGSSYGFTLIVLPPSKDQKEITMSSHGWMVNEQG